MNKVIIDPTVTNLLGGSIDEDILKECEASPKKAGIIIKSHLYDKLKVDEVPKIALQQTAEGLVVKVH